MDPKVLAMETNVERTRLTCYKAGDEGLAFFRIQARNACFELTMTAAEGKKVSKAQKAYFEPHLKSKGDLGDRFRAFVKALESHTGNTLGLEYS